MRQPASHLDGYGDDEAAMPLTDIPWFGAIILEWRTLTER
jgi:hypothetical protein